MRTIFLLWLASALTAIGCIPAGATEVVLHNFNCPLRGAVPFAGLIRDSAGSFYGTTSQGGSANQGVVYKLNSAGHQTVLYSFTGGADGSTPYSALIQDSVGNLYGTASAGGAAGAGVVYKLDTTGHQTVLYSFTGGADGSGPFGGVTLDAAGNLYGATRSGGAYGAVVVPKSAPDGPKVKPPAGLDPSDPLKL